MTPESIEDPVLNKNTASESADNSKIHIISNDLRQLELEKDVFLMELLGAQDTYIVNEESLAVETIINTTNIQNVELNSRKEEFISVEKQNKDEDHLVVDISMKKVDSIELNQQSVVAATQIQKIARGKNIRKKILPSKGVVQTQVAMKAEEGYQAFIAATKIQKIVRGKNTRKTFKLPTESKLIGNKQVNSSERAFESEPTKEIVDNFLNQQDATAATKIQKVFRGLASRENLKKVAKSIILINRSLVSDRTDIHTNLIDEVLKMQALAEVYEDEDIQFEDEFDMQQDIFDIDDS